MTIKIGVVGGGASGMMAAIIAAESGGEVTVFDRLDRVGKKILATGNGRCNMTNINTTIDRFHGEMPTFALGALENFDVESTMAFFERLGIFCKVEDGKVYPYSDQASGVLDVLRYEMESLGVEIHCTSAVTSIEAIKSGFSVTVEKGDVFYFDRVILSTGGKASPNLGSNGSGYKLALKFGHRLIEPFPALVQLQLKGDFLKGLKGVKFDGEVTVGCGETVLRREEGEILYTEYGISGPPVIQLSRVVAKAISVGEKPWLRVNMFPSMNEKEVLKMLRQRLALAEEKPLQLSFTGLINKRIPPILLKQGGIWEINKPCAMVTEEEIRIMAKLLTAWEYRVTGTRPWSDAQATAGGISVDDIWENTMESKLIKNLYMAGEILDIDGDCGGFNLQWAWSSGYTAGLFASMEG